MFKEGKCLHTSDNVEAKKTLRNVTAVLYGFQRYVILNIIMYSPRNWFLSFTLIRTSWGVPTMHLMAVITVAW